MGEGEEEQVGEEEGVEGGKGVSASVRVIASPLQAVIRFTFSLPVFFLFFVFISPDSF